MFNVFCLCAVPSVEHSIKCLENIQSYYILHVFYCLIFVNLLNEHNVLINVHSKCYVVIFYFIFKNVYLFSSLYLHIHYVYFYIYYMQCKMVMMHYILWGWPYGLNAAIHGSEVLKFWHFDISGQEGLVRYLSVHFGKQFWYSMILSITSPTKLARLSLSMSMAKSIIFSKPKSL